MLIPQFSMRRMLLTITGLSVVFLILAQAVGGHVWAIGIIVGLVALVAISLVQALTFFVVWLFASVTAKRKAAKTAEKAALFVILTMATQALAGGGVYTLPLSGRPTPSGLTVTLNDDWPEGMGYRPLTFTANSTHAANADRTLSFEVCFHAWDPDEPLMTIQADLELAAGVTQATKTIAAPDFLFYKQYSLKTWENGRHQPALSASSLGNTGMYYDTPELMPAALFVAASQPDATALNDLFPQRQYNASSNPATASFAPQWSWRAANALPEEWLCYQSLDLLFISLADLQSLTAPRLQAICDWTRAGGNLLVFGMGDDWANLDRLAQAIQLNPAEQGNAWRTPQAEALDGPGQSGFIDLDWPVDEADEQAAAGTANNPGVQPKAILASPAQAPFRFRPFQQGMVVALAPVDPFGQSLASSDWYRVMNTLGSARWVGARRTGISFVQANFDFWTFLVPGVGGAPVNAYRVLITAFVVLIGPVNYLVLRKRRRLHLLLFTVPASALLVTGGLLAYALLADGLHTRVRSRSFTMLDQRSGDAVSWARLAYYSGLAPADGLRFAREVAVIPYPQGNEPYDRRMQRVFDVQADHHQLTRGWLPSRTLVQLVTARPYQSAQKLVVTDDNGAIRVRNDLGVRIQQLLVCDAAGKFGYGRNILPQQSQRLTTVTVPNPSGGSQMGPAIEGMREAFDSQALSLPTGFDQNNGMGFFGVHSYVPRHYGYQGKQPLAGQAATSRLETSLEAAKQAILQVGSQAIQATDPLALTARSYIAIIDRPEAVPLGLDAPREVASFHILHGEY